MKEEIIAGRNPVAEALRSGRALNKVMVQDGARGVTEIIAAAREKGVAVEFVKSDKLDKLAKGVRHQGVVAYAAPVEFKTLEDALKKAAAKGEAPFLLLLDELQDPQNLGALIRTADAAGVHGILLPKRRSCPLNAVVAKISAGAVEYVPVIQIGNIVQQLKDLKKQKDLTILFISHDLNVIRYLADRVGIMYFGRLIEENTTDKIFNFPEQEYTKILLESAPTLAY